MRITLTATGSTEPAQVWERYAEPRLWSSWSPQIRTVTPHDRIHAGMRGTVDWLVPFVVLDVDEPRRRWSWIAGRRPARVHLEHAVFASETGTRTTLTLVGPAVLVAPYLPVALLALRRLVS